MERISSTTAANGLVDAALEVHGVGAGGYVEADGDDSWASTVAVVIAVAGVVAGLDATSLDELCARSKGSSISPRGLRLRRPW